MRCLEAAQQATKTPSSVTATPDAVIAWARAFETFVVGAEPETLATASARTKVTKAKTSEAV
jgi:hypothetical protein